ncbi:hypothetical protein XENTR_v10013280 [Xenopus tropicalis]|nr:hypothetical protein XENTR_v10013280 [Xenopus tropicalis]
MLWVQGWAHDYPIGFIIIQQVGPSLFKMGSRLCYCSLIPAIDGPTVIFSGSICRSVAKQMPTGETYNINLWENSAYICRNGLLCGERGWNEAQQ